jgi:MHS family proline/betaine transporter-like MFS transporter
LFAVGFIFRPLGSIIFGYIGDKYGRKTALVISVSLMGTASLGMFMLPSYELMGVSACYLIAFIRVIQGISVGGEYSGAIIYAVEHFNKKNSGLVGSIVVAGCLSGVLLATLIGNLIKLPIMPEYSWRFAFLLGSGLSLVGFFIRKKLKETPEFLSINKEKGVPLLNGLKEFKTEAVSAVLLAATNGVNLYYVVVYLPGYLQKTTGLDLWFLPIITTVTLATLSPFFGWVSDRVSRIKVVLFGVAVVANFSFIMLFLVGYYQNTSSICVIFVIHAILYSIQAGTMNTLVVELFPAKYRFSCSAFCYSIGMGAIGGTSPMIAAYIVSKYNNITLILSSYIAGIAFLGFLSLYAVVLKRKRVKKERLIQINSFVAEERCA